MIGSSVAQFLVNCDGVQGERKEGEDIGIATRQLKGGPVLFWAKGRSYSCWGDRDMTGCHESNWN